MLIKKEPDNEPLEASGYTPTLVYDVPSMAATSILVEGSLSQKLDSLDLEIDQSDLISDMNFNNLMVNLDSGNNITFNSSGNIAEINTPSSSGTVTYATLNTPQILEEVMNPLSRYMSHQNDLSKREA